MTENPDERQEEPTEVEAARERIANLREEIAQAEADKAEQVREESDKVELAALAAEEARLERELAAVKGTPPPVEAPVLDNPAGTATAVSTPPTSTPSPFGANVSDTTDNDDKTDEE